MRVHVDDSMHSTVRNAAGGRNVTKSRETTTLMYTAGGALSCTEAKRREVDTLSFLCGQFVFFPNDIMLPRRDMLL